MSILGERPECVGHSRIAETSAESAGQGGSERRQLLRLGLDGHGGMQQAQECSRRLRIHMTAGVSRPNEEGSDLGF